MQCMRAAKSMRFGNFNKWQILTVITFLFVAIYYCLLKLKTEVPSLSAFAQLPDTLVLQENWRYCTIIPGSTKKICGKKFNGRRYINYLLDLELTEFQTQNMTKDDDVEIMEADPVFVTALSANQYYSAKTKVLEGFKTFLPDKKLIVVDLGLEIRQIVELNSDPQISEVRNFEFKKYPKHVQNLMDYHWKPLIFAELLIEYNSVLYFDALERVIINDTNYVKQQLSCNLKAPNFCQHYPMSLLWNTWHSIFAATNPKLYEYLPAYTDGLKRIEMGHAGFVVIYGTSDVRREILKWAVLCALQKDCMAPEGSTRSCKFVGNSCDAYAGCHRYDHSVFNILLANRHKYVRTKYHFEFNIPPEQKKFRKNTSCVVAL